MDFFWYKVVVYIHIVAAIVWVGGILFLGLVAAPAARRLDDDTRSSIINKLGSRFVTVGYASLAVLAVTGIVQAGFHGATWATVFNGSFFVNSDFGRTLALKLLSVAVMLGVSVSHDFFVGPAAVRAREAGKDATNLRKLASWLARITALLALVVIYYAMQLVR